MNSNNGEQHCSDPFDDFIIHRYSRQQAIEDGVLVDLTEWGRETGFVIPVACTSQLWQEYVVPAASLESEGQSTRGRAHDLLWMLLLAIRLLAPGKSEPTGPTTIAFRVVFLMAPGRHQRVQFKAHCGPGDNSEPVLTIMLPHED